LRFAHYDRNFSNDNDNNNRKQTGLGFQLSHNRSFGNDLLYIGASVFHAQRLASSGSEVEDLLGIENNKTTSFSQLGEAFFGIKLSDNTQIKLGRFQHKSLLLKSKTRLLPSTFQGAKLEWALSDSLTLNAYQFNKWSRRANKSFEGFQTELSEPGSVRHLSIVNLSHSHQFGKTQLEVLNTSKYLTKLGISSELTLPLKSDYSFTLDSGLFSSHDGGVLFVEGADSTLDVNNNNPQSGRLKHDGLGGYIQFGFAKSFEGFSHSATLTHSRFGQAWLEDSFAGDHGTSPFPTSTMGPELTNRHERIWMASFQTQNLSGSLSGLTSKISVTNAYGAFNALGEQFGTGSESWIEIDLRYKPQRLKRVSARLRYRDYRSTELGRIAGIKSNRDELRVTLDYKFKF
jgi:hypothetical protein